MQSGQVGGRMHLRFEQLSLWLLRSRLVLHFLGETATSPVSVCGAARAIRQQRGRLPY